jgi:DNA-directed RNA polymerase specialized sigma24 family protein
MQVSPMTVQRLLHRALEQLRGHLEVADFRSPGRVDPGRSAARVC